MGGGDVSGGAVRATKEAVARKKSDKGHSAT